MSWPPKPVRRHRGRRPILVLMLGVCGLLLPALVSAERIRCRFLPPAGAPPGRQYTCHADHVTTQFYRRISSCRGTAASSCLLDIQQFQHVRLWSPDSTVEQIVNALPPRVPANRSVVFTTFKRAAAVTKGPWILAVTPTTATIRWETNAPAESRVHIGNQFGPPIHSQWALGTSVCTEGSGPCLHTTSISGLSPAHNYNYLLGDTAPLPLMPATLHPTGTLTTAPTGAAPFSFAVLGDAQYNNASAPWPFSEVSSFTCAERSDLRGPLLHTGDMVWSSPGDDAWSRFFSHGAQMLANCPFVPVPGNNDDPAGFGRLFLSPTSSATIRAFDHGNTHFILLDSNDLAGSETFLKADLGSSAVAAAANLILVVHYGPYGYGWYNDNSGIKTLLETLLADPSYPALFQKLRLVLSGHQHYYERIRKPFTQGSAHRTIRFITVGSAGAEVRCPDAPASHPDLEAASRANCPAAGVRYHFQGLVFRVLDTTLEGRVRDFEYNSAGKLLSRTLLDCFAFDAAGASVPVSCGP